MPFNIRTFSSGVSQNTIMLNGIAWGNVDADNDREPGKIGKDDVSRSEFPQCPALYAHAANKLLVLR